MTVFNTIAFDAVEVGQELPELSIDITPRMVVATAMASRDYQDVHHDYKAAKAAGTDDIFMNILTTNGLVGRFVTDWSGPASRLKAVKIKLGVPNYPDDTMVMKGEVISKDQQGDTHLLEVDIKGKNSMGYHVTGSVTVVVPKESAPAAGVEKDAVAGVEKGSVA